jgi:hypothetical protein
MPGHILLTPLKWFQEISHYPAINVEGQNLKVSCTLAAAPDLLLSNKAKFTGLAAELGILVGERPIDEHGNPLKQGIGCFYFSDAQASRDNLPGMLDPSLHGWLYLKPDSYAAVWDQVRDGGYVGCSITLKVGPVQNELPPMSGMSVNLFSSWPFRFDSHASQWQTRLQIKQPVPSRLQGLLREGSGYRPSGK